MELPRGLVEPERAGAVVLHGGRVLLIERTAEMDGGPSGLVLPKGRRKPGETLPRAALREVEEETGVVLYPIRSDDFLGCVVRGSVAEGYRDQLKTTAYYQGLVQQPRTDRLPDEVPRWMPVYVALGAMRYVEERKFLQDVLPRVRTFREITSGR